MRLFLLLSALTVSLVMPGIAPAAPTAPTSWTSQANQVCAVWLAKAKKEFGTPVTPAQLYSFAVKAKTLEAAELAVLEKIPGRSAAGTQALAAMRADVALVGSSISAFDHGDAKAFITILKKYLNDHRAKDAFAVAGAHACG
jgi:phage gp16-like protein